MSTDRPASSTRTPTLSRLAVLVPGGRGQLGAELKRTAPRGSLVHAPGSKELDITDESDVADTVDSFVEAAQDAELSPVVINAAAYTAVDDAEHDAATAERVNARGPALLAKACRANGTPLIQVSTDYVFAGQRPARPESAAIPEGAAAYQSELDITPGSTLDSALDIGLDVDATTSPLSVYGKTKLDGERAVLRSEARAWVVRTAWVFSAGRANFVQAMKDKALAGEDPVSAVDDQVSSPTWAVDLARGLWELASAIVRGNGPESRILHCVNPGAASRFELAQAVFAELGAEISRVRPVTSTEFPRPAPRPAFSALSDRSWRDAGLTPLRPWRDAVRECLR